MSDYRRVLALVLPGLLPWSVVTWPGGNYLVFAFGWTGRGLGGFQSLPRVLAMTASAVVQAWLVAVVLYGLALASAALGAVGREDPRGTAGLLALAGASVLGFSLRVSGQGDLLAVPVGLVTLWTGAAVIYRDRGP